MSHIVAAISIRRRTAAFAVFRGLHLEGVIVRHIPTDSHHAENTILGFAHEVCSRYRVPAVVLERSERSSSRIDSSYSCVRKALQQQSVSLHEVALEDLLESYAYRLLKQRQHLRRIARKIWPVLDNKQYGVAALDAAVLGLHLQTKHLLNIHPEEQ